MKAFYQRRSISRQDSYANAEMNEKHVVAACGSCVTQVCAPTEMGQARGLWENVDVGLSDELWDHVFIPSINYMHVCVIQVSDSSQTQMILKWHLDR